MFPGLTSRCKMPTSCAACSAPASFTPMLHGLPPIERPVAADQSLQRVLRVIGHHDERPTRRSRADLVNGHDVRVVGQLAHGSLFTHEALDVVRVEIRRQDLDRDGPVQRRLSAAVDDAESAMSDFGYVVETRIAEFGRDAGNQILLCRVWIALGHRRSPSSLDGTLRRCRRPGGFSTSTRLNLGRDPQGQRRRRGRRRCPRITPAAPAP